MRTYLFLNAFVLFLFMPFFGNGQLVILTGKITNQKTGNSLQSVNVLETKSGIGTISNLDGSYSLMLKPGTAKLLITREGFKEFSSNMILINDTSVNVVLTPITDIKSKDKVLEARETAEVVKRNKQH